MISKKNLIAVVLATFCLTSTLFMVIPIRSPTTDGEYDPWVDTNDDGIIDYHDLYNLASIYRTSGTPINKTDLLHELQARLDSLNASIIGLQSTVGTLQTTVGTLQTRISALEASECIVKYNNIGTVMAIPTTPTNLGSVTLSVPTNGYVLLTATASVVTFGDNTVCNFGLGTTSGSTDLHEATVGVLDGSGTQRREFSVTSFAVVPVTPGSRTFYATAYKPSVFSAQTVNLGNVYLTAVFYGS